MSEATTLSAALESVDVGPAWHGPAVQEALKGVTPEQASAKPVDGAHSIWELVLHMTSWLRYTAGVLRGEDGAFEDAYRDWPPAPDAADGEAWQQACRELEGALQETRELMVHCDDARLREPVPGRDFPLKVLLHGIIHHTVYHVGQIALLKKAMG